MKELITLSVLLKRGGATWSALSREQQRRMDTLIATSERVGHTRAHLQLAEMHKEGKGVLKDDTQAMFWYCKAPEILM